MISVVLVYFRVNSIHVLLSNKVFLKVCIICPPETTSLGHRPSLEVQKLQSQCSKRVESSESTEVNHCNFISNFGERLEGPSPETEAVLPAELQRKGMRPTEWL